MVNKPAYQIIADYAAQFNEGVTRAEIAEQFNMGKGGAKDHLERAVKHGLLSKTYTWVKGGSRGWVYFQPYQQTPQEHAERLAYEAQTHA